ncbi:Sir2 family NAD-dependent protein deacetylase [Spirochaeta cellobiosiphila]|uniref:Sir2 family NAD-dependent protein deacetylase n=1 Tax=Spirochaeta cellobiosiphila TaxID=504483 RepID=UPI00042019FA|nr:Sir2 family NAD-dependent protein deacetylase [Spirochaeta cellobiosiphila]
MNRMDEAVQQLKEAKNIVVFTGAGVSTSSGIPDFRGPNGLYSFAEKKYNLPYPEAIFDINYFHKHPEPFFMLSKELLAQDIHPSPVHEFLSWLESKNKLELILTQNIDMLHTKAGNEKVLECHGSYLTGHCMECQTSYQYDEYAQDIQSDQIPICQCGGIIKPDVVFFGEALPDEFYRVVRNPPKADFILVLGTSLQVHPVAGIALDWVKNVSSLLINQELTGVESSFSFTFQNDLDQTIKEIWDRLR